MYEIRFKDGNEYTGEYGPVMFVEGVAKVKDDWIATWFKGRGFVVNKVDVDTGETPPVDINTLTVDQLKELAKEREIEGFSKIKKDELIEVLKGGE